MFTSFIRFHIVLLLLTPSCRPTFYRYNKKAKLIKKQTPVQGRTRDFRRGGGGAERRGGGAERGGGCRDPPKKLTIQTSARLS